MDDDQQQDDDDLLAQQDEMLALKDSLEMKSEEECREDFLQVMDCHDQTKYRKKIKGFHIAFNIRDKVGRMGENELSNYKFKSKLPPEEIKKLVAEAKFKRAQEKIMKEREEKEKYQRERESLRKMHEQLRREKGLMTGRKELAKAHGYHEGNMKSGDEKHLKITFAVIEKMHYSDFNSGNEAEDFKPSDIIDEEDPNYTDDEVLRKFKNEINMRDPYEAKMLARGISKENLVSIDTSIPSTLNAPGIGLKPNL
jgi:hypothetical protein